MSFEELRRQYLLGGMNEAELHADPIAQFHEWLQAAIDTAPAPWVEPYAMNLATTELDGRVTARIVLLRGADARGFVFYTSYNSLKGQQLARHDRAALVFYWGYLERQVRIEGRVAKIDRERADDYFHRRPRGSQLSAAVSSQSAVVSSRADLEHQVAELDAALGNQEVPLPDHWGGYCVDPEQIEFWQGRENRLHDRFLYQRLGAAWRIQRLVARGLV